MIPDSEQKEEALSNLPSHCPLNQAYKKLRYQQHAHFSKIISDSRNITFKTFLDNAIKRIVCRLFPTINTTPAADLGDLHTTKWREEPESLDQIHQSLWDLDQDKCVFPPREFLDTKGSPFTRHYLNKKNKREYYTGIRLGTDVAGNPVVVRAHALMCWLWNGPPPDDKCLHASHVCNRHNARCTENARCINPWHLAWESLPENVANKRARREEMGEVWAENLPEPEW